MNLRRIIALGGGALAVLAICYGIAWFVIADRLRNGIDRWVADRRADGWTAEHGDIAISGFPLTWRARVMKPRLVQSKRRPHFLWSGPSFDMTWVPWQTRDIDFRTTGTHRLGLGSTEEALAIPLTMTQASGRLSFAPSGGLSTVAFRIDEASFPARDGETVKVSRITNRFDSNSSGDNIPADELRLKPAFRIDTTLSGLVLPAASKPALGQTVDTIELRGTLLGELPPGNLREVASRWRDGGGTLEIERIDLRWSALQVIADGTMALDRTLQPVGALTARITGYDQTMDRLVAARIVRPGEALLAKFALGALARDPGNGGPPELKASVSIQDGWIYLGPVKLLPAPRVSWN